MNLIETLNWRYAAKRMTGKKIPEGDLQLILESIRMAPTSYGLQPFSVVVIEDENLINEIYEKACPQVVLKQCSQLLVFKARQSIDEELVDGYIEDLISARNSTEEEIKVVREKIENIQNDPSYNRLSWAMRQAYIALGYATFAAAKLNIDTTPIEGFNPKALNEVMKVDLDKEEAVVMLTLGYRDEDEDRAINYAKVRRSAEKMFERI